MPVLKYTLPTHFIRRFTVAALSLMFAVGGCADSNSRAAIQKTAARAKSTFIESSAPNDSKSTFTPDSVQHFSDGDSMTLRHLGRVRLAGVDCPELHQQGGPQAAQFTRGLINHKTIEIEICREDPQDMYGRKLVFLYYTDAAGNRQMLNTILLRQGYARVYENTPCLTGKRDAWKADYESARRQHLGLFATEGEVPDGKIYRRRHPR